MSDGFFITVGLFGPALFLWSYAMVALGYWNAAQLRTHIPNLLGALALLVSLIRFWNGPAFLLEICWACISIYGIIKSLRIQRLS